MKQDPPSATYDKYWLNAYNPDYTDICDIDFDYSGKWLVFIPVSRLDETWERIKQATETRKLGIQAKTATMRNNPNATSPVCVCTKDFRDLTDVTIVLGGLRQLGFAGRLNYKEDNATFGRFYGKGASLYTSPSGLIVKQLRQPIIPE